MELEGLLKLPAELLDRTYAYLDWDAEIDLVPTRPDIFSLSITCKRLRETVLPTLFRHVTLRLRWCNDVLLEPALFRLRRDHPHLARHVRSVMIEVEYDQLSRSVSLPSTYQALDKAWARYERDFEATSQHLPFITSDSVADWVDPSYETSRSALDPDLGALSDHIRKQYNTLFTLLESTGGSSAGLAWLPEAQAAGRQLSYDYQRQRKEQHAADIHKLETELRIYHETGQWPLDPNEDQGQNGTPPPKDPKMRTERSRARLQLDAFALALNCLPPSTRCLILRAVPGHPAANGAQNFALATTAAALRLLGPKLSALTMLTREITTHDMSMSLTSLMTSQIPEFGETLHMRPEVLAQLKSFKVLRLSGAAEESQERKRTLKQLSKSQYWSSTSATIETLELWHIDAAESTLLSFLGAFGLVRHVRLHHMMLSNAHAPRPANMTSQCAQAVSLLQFAISFRRAMPVSSLHLHAVEHFHKSRVPAAAVRFIDAEVCSVGSLVDDDRVQRLMQDFESFYPSWQAEEAEVVDKAVQDKEFGKLIDQAMCTRL